MKTAEQLLNEFVGTDEAAQTYINNYSTKVANARDIRTYLIEVGKWRNMLSLDMANPLFDAADGLRLAAEEDRPITFNPDTIRGGKYIAMLDAFTSAGLIGEDIDKPAILAIAESNKPYHLSLSEVKAIRSPSTWKSVAIGSGNSHVVLAESIALLSNTNRGGFRFTINPNESFSGSVGVRIKAKTVESTEFAYIEQFTQTIERDFEQGVLHAHVLSRSAALSGYRHFIFEYLEPYKDALTSVSVEALV